MRFFLVLFFVFFSIFAHSGMWSKNSILGERVCSKSKDVCLKVSVDHDIRNSKLELNGRVNRVKRSGWARLHLYGYSGSERVSDITIKFYVDGKWSQVVKAYSKKLYGVDRDVRFKIHKLYF